ncbi:RNA-dependent RNA polymerase [Culex tritaeniorhynchus totivirus]|uniref:RNA-dependent RNA polymerase n=1 Tax=Culex tritaeniorhynchus totivirus TaxID=1870981 RepID=UPI0008273450|nr:RNA-dependent RNA polymerase [Culex tritaeniorhynchus totivirus]ANZ93873.1 RNA-dependent RNA polymerase [Culex tritaeniorhynchus totivirus]
MVISFIVRKLDLDSPITTPGDLSDLPLRTKGDYAITRLRLKDILPRIDRDIVTFFSSTLCHLDQILVCNLMIWSQIWGLDRIKALHATGLLNSFEVFATKASKLSSYVKRFPFDDHDCKQRYAELNTLTGYIQNNFGTFNYEEEFEALATGGNEHPPGWLNIFTRKVREIMTTQPLPEFITLETYVKEGKWITGGSSSIGKVEWSYDGDAGKFKARKNMLMDLYTKEELYDIALGWDGSLQNRVFVKDELSKRRLAVASNIEAYLNQGYILYLFGHGFKNYKYITLDEKPGEQHVRNVETINHLRDGSFALPFDFKGFDRQPTLEEIKIIMARIGDLILPGVPGPYKHEVSTLIARNISSFDNCYLYSPETKQTKRQTGGLSSGIRPTSLIGNVWNSIVTDIARDITEHLLGKTIQSIQLRGDDTYILSKSWFALVVFRYAYQSINAIGENSKFGIMQACCEFLRTEISVTGVRGWTNRAIPSVTQRKPWNPQPWTANSETITVANNIYLLERRSKLKLDWLHQCNKIKWSKYARQSHLWLELPKHLGGIGIYKWRGWIPNCKLPLAQSPTFKVPGLKPDNVAVNWFPMDVEDARKYQQVEFSAKIAADDIPGPQRHMAVQYIKELRSIRPEWTKTSVGLARIYKIEGPTSSNKLWPKNPIRADISANNPQFPVYNEFVRQHQLLKRAKVEGLKSLMEYTLLYYPSIYKKITSYEQRGWHRTDAINLAVGQVPLEPTKILNPILSVFVQKMVYKSGLPFWKGRKTIAQLLEATTRQAVAYVQEQGGASMYAF